MAGTARSTDFPDNSQRNIFRRNAERQVTMNRHPHVFGFFLNQRLGCQNMFDFRRSDTMSKRPECPMSGGVGITADDRHPGKGQPLLRPDDMNNTTAIVSHGKVGNTEFRCVSFQRVNLKLAFRISDAFLNILGRNVVVGNRESRFGTPNLPASDPQTFKGLRAGHFMNEMAIDVKNIGFVFQLIYNMAVPDFVI